MGFGAKLNFAFIAVILVMAITQVAFSVFVDLSKSRSKANAIVDPVLNCANTDVKAIFRKNVEIAAAIEKSAEFKRAIAAKDRAGVAQAIKQVFDRVGFSGYGTVIQEDGIVFFSSDIPSKFGYRPSEINRPLVLRAFQYNGQGPFACGLCVLSCSETPTLSSLVPVTTNGQKNAVLAVSMPFGAELLQGMERKIKITKDLKDFEMAFYVMAGTRVTACSPGLLAAKPSYLARLNRAQVDPFGDKGGSSESDGRLWKNLPIAGPNGSQALGQILVCTPLPNPLGNLTVLMFQLGIAALAAFLLSCLFSAGLSSRFSASMRFLKQRAKDLAANRHDLPSLSALNDDWLELAEMMDTALTSPRAAVLNLKQTISTQVEELSERQRQIDAINSQLEMVNKQMAAHNRQALEVNNQVGMANKHAVQVQQKLDAVMQCSTEAFLVLDPYGSVLSANPIFLKWSGAQERDIAGKMVFDLIRKPGEPREMQNVSFANPASGPGDLINQFFPEGVVYHRSENKHVDCLMHLQPVCNEEGAIQGYVMVLRDKSLHAEVNRLKNEIVTMLSQDIRTPLTQAESHWQAILNQQLQGVNPSIAQHLLEMHKVYEQMLGLADSYLMMYGGFVPPSEPVLREKVSVTRLIGECLESVSQNARAQQIMLDYKTVTGLPSTAINKEIVRDIIINLLEKLISVTAPGGRVRAETTVKGKEIRLIISSSGPALQQVEIEEMFIGFVDGKHTEDTYQTRLNMYLARNNAERLGGRIWAESEAGRGTAIFLTLPVH